MRSSVSKMPPRSGLITIAERSAACALPAYPRPAVPFPCPGDVDAEAPVERRIRLAAADESGDFVAMLDRSPRQRATTRLLHQMESALPYAALLIESPDAAAALAAVERTTGAALFRK
jgi:hypothetical protein